MKELLALLFDFFIGLRKCYGFPSLWFFHDYLFKIKSFLGKFTAFLPMNKPRRSIKFCPILPFLIAKFHLGLPGSIILTRQVMIQGMDLTNPYRIPTISSDSYIPISIFALHHRHKTQTSELISILHNLLSLIVLVESGVPDLSGQFFFWRLFFVLRFWFLRRIFIRAYLLTSKPTTCLYGLLRICSCWVLSFAIFSSRSEQKLDFPA